MTEVRINGASVQLDDGATVADAVRAAGVEGNARGVAVALDGEVVPRGKWASTDLGDGAEVEILQAVQGG